VVVLSKHAGFSSLFNVQTIIGTIKISTLIFLFFVCTLLGMKTPSKKRRGRPPKSSDQIKGIRLDMRLEQAEKDTFRDAAELAGLDLSAWIRERLRSQARKELQSAGKDVAFLK
jgi:hypothetical protein